ncbi:MAG: hypothetical protein K0Q50_2525 [Vampirovibrio sp.]|nr:hypothetical protein [Vampirovibrio sp.]
MASSYGSYGYGDYSGYGGYYGYNQQQGGSVLGSNTSMSMTNSQLASTPNLDGSNTSNITKGVSETYNKTMQGGGEKKGFFDHFKDFFKGIFNGLKNLLKSLADPKTWLLIAACIALCVMVPGAGTALMVLGVGMAGMQIFKGVSSGDASQVGEGVFNLGLCFLGGSNSVKAGKGAEAGNFSRAGTRVAEAEKALAAAQKSKDAKAIASAEKSLEAARVQLARADASAISGAQREAHLARPNVANLKTADDFTAAKASTQKGHMEARASVDSARARLAEAEKSGNAASVEKAKSALATAETNAKVAANNVHDVYLAARIRDMQNMGMMGRAGEYVKNSGTLFKDNFAMAFGKPMTSADGRTISYWSRTPKTDDAAAAAKQSKDKPKPAAEKEGVPPPLPKRNSNGTPKPKEKPKSIPSQSPWVRTPEQAKLAADRAKNKNVEPDYNPGVLYGETAAVTKKPLPTDPKPPVTNISHSSDDIATIQKANGQHFDNVQQVRAGRPQDPPPTPPSSYFAETPGWGQRIKDNAFTGFMGSQSVSPLFGMIMGGQGGSLLG